MKNSGEPERLDHLAVVEFSGVDAARFLHGQLSSDVLALADGDAQLTSLNSPKGRVVAILRLLRVAERFYGVLPQDLAGQVMERLSKYVLRAKVSIQVSTELAAYGTPDRPNRLVLNARSVQSPVRDSAAVVDDWKRANIALGIAQIYTATSELFVAQMLNLDRVQGISFSKGCYTGQEIIARTQNLGRIKRRMLRFRTGPGPSLRVADPITLVGFGTATVVETAAVADGGREFLAVVHLEPHGDDPKAAAQPLEAHELPMPYTLPERPV